MPQINLQDHYWKLDDGRIWSTREARFVSPAVPKAAGFDPVPESPVDALGNHSVQGLQEALVFYDLPRGELATADDRRAERDRLLAESDKYAMTDNPCANKEAWLAYRQALRDVPAQKGFPGKVTWPVKPE